MSVLAQGTGAQSRHRNLRNRCRFRPDANDRFSRRNAYWPVVASLGWIIRQAIGVLKGVVSEVKDIDFRRALANGQGNRPRVVTMAASAGEQTCHRSVVPAWSQRAGEYFRDQLRNVDVTLRDGRTYLMGDQFTTADILLTRCLTWAIDNGVGICESAEPYFARTTAREAYLAGEKANLPKGHDASL